MRMREQDNKPFSDLGAQLKSLRERNQESIEDASGAAEIDPPTLEAFEEGTERPAEDTLHVLLHHFDVSDEQADELWHLAGYRDDRPGSTHTGRSDGYQSVPAMFVLPIDGRILYSDSVQVNVNSRGVVINFMQNAGPDGKPIPVSRIGMSKQHAQSMIDLMTECLTRSKPKQLPDKKSTDRQG